MSVHFSVIVPMFNAAKTLSETLQSIAAQSYPHFEVICINDGSTDRSEQIASKWHEQHPEINFTLINQKNGGLGNARNRGIKAAKNAWTAFLDADDTWLPNKLSKVSEFLSQHEADVVYHSFVTFGGRQEKTRNIFPVKSIKGLLSKGNPIMPSAAVVRTALLLEFPFSEDPAVHGAEDFDLWLRLLHANKTFEHLGSVLTRYRETGGMSTRITEHLEHVENVISNYHQKNWFKDDIFQKAICRKNWEAGRHYHKVDKFEDALKYYEKAGKLNTKQKSIQLLAKMNISI